MTILLTNGDSINLQDDNLKLEDISIVLGWNAESAKFGLSLSILILGEDNRIFDYGNSFIHYNKPIAFDGFVLHLSDNLVGAENFEVIMMMLNKAPKGVSKILIFMALNDIGSECDFSTIKDVHVRIVNSFKFNMAEVIRYNLEKDYKKNEKSVIIGEIYKKSGGWFLRARRDGFIGGYNYLIKQYISQESIQLDSVDVMCC